MLKFVWKKVSIVHICGKRLIIDVEFFHPKLNLDGFLDIFIMEKLYDIIISSSLLNFMIYGAINFNEAV